jgi:hypothetical protein
MGIIAASAPSLYPLFKMAVERSRQVASVKFWSSSGNTLELSREERIRTEGLELPVLRGSAMQKFEGSEEALNTVDEQTVHHGDC